LISLTGDDFTTVIIQLLHNFDYLVISAFFFCCDITSVVINVKKINNNNTKQIYPYIPDIPLQTTITPVIINIQPRPHQTEIAIDQTKQTSADETHQKKPQEHEPQSTIATYSQHQISMNNEKNDEHTRVDESADDAALNII